MADKLTKQELKEPDAFMKVGGEARDWLEGRWRMVAIAATVLILVGAGAALASYVSARGEEKASRELGEALKVLSRPVVAVEGAELNALDNKEPPFKSEKDKQEGVRKALESFRAQHPGTRAAETAALPLADAQFRLGDYDKAIESAKDYLKSAPPNEPMRVSAFETQGYAHEAKKDYAPALAAFQEMAKESKTEFLSGMGNYHQARILVLQGKKDEAAKVLSDLTTSHPGTAAARLSADRLTVLAAEGVKIPAAAASTPDAGR